MTVSLQANKQIQELERLAKYRVFFTWFPRDSKVYAIGLSVHLSVPSLVFPPPLPSRRV